MPNTKGQKKEKRKKIMPNTNSSYSFLRFHSSISYSIT